MLTALLASLALAASTDWTATFGPNETGTYVEAHAKLLVVPAGTPAAPAQEATTALVAALRQSGKADLVMTAEPLGDVSALDDQAIVKKAAALPVSRIAVVRVFPGATGQPSTAVVSIYDKSGTATGALSGTSGQLLTAMTGSAGNEGVSSSAVSAITHVQKEAEEGNKKAQEEYDLKFVGFDDGITVNARTGALLATWSIPFQGKYKKPLEGVDFYQAIGREDLAAKFNQVMAVRNPLVYSGLALIAVGLAVPLVGFVTTDWSTPYNYSPVSLFAGLGISVVGFTLWGVGIHMDPNPVTAIEARQLVDEHNTSLRKKLGLPPLRASLQIGGDRLGLRLSGAF